MDFFEQFEKLRLNVPRLALMNFQGERSPYGNFTFRCIDCYYSIGSDFLKNSHYNYWGYHNKNSVDCSYCRDCDECYECLDCLNCYDCSYLQDCEDCRGSSYCFDCQSLQDCFACIGLWRKQYHIYNKPYTKEKYFETVEKLKNKPPEELRKLFREVKKIRPHIFMHQNHNEADCTGDYMYRSRNCQYCFDVDHCENSAYLNNAINCSNSYDISFAGEPSVKDCYEIMSGMGLENCMFCNSCWHGKNLEYSEYCFESEYCFGCIGLKKRKFYIFNMPYTPEAYSTEVAKIKDKMRSDRSYGKWFSTVYPIEDTKASEEFACIEHPERREPQGLRIQNQPSETELWPRAHQV